MEKNRDNCLILFVNPVEDDKISDDLKTAFGTEQAKKVYKDLLTNTYKKIKRFQNAIPIISYKKTTAHPDMTWLDSDDPGFVEFRNKNLEDRIRDTFRLSFLTGAKKAILVNPMAPEVKEEWVAQAFESISDKTAAMGICDDGGFYLLGLTQQNLKILDSPGFTFGKSAEIITDRFKKNKISVFFTPESYTVKNEETLKKWNSKPKYPDVEIDSNEKQVQTVLKLEDPSIMNIPKRTHKRSQKAK